MTPVEFGRTAWILSADLDALRSSPTPLGVRLLPPRDPYTQARDRDTIIDQLHQRDVWKAVGAPGAVLADGEVIGVWRPRKSGRNLTVTITTFGALPARAWTLLHAEAEQIAALRGASSTNVEFDTS